MISIFNNSLHVIVPDNFSSKTLTSFHQHIFSPINHANEPRFTRSADEGSPLAVTWKSFLSLACCVQQSQREALTWGTDLAVVADCYVPTDKNVESNQGVRGEFPGEARENHEKRNKLGQNSF